MTVVAAVAVAALMHLRPAGARDRLRLTPPRHARTVAAVVAAGSVAAAALGVGAAPVTVTVTAVVSAAGLGALSRLRRTRVVRGRSREIVVLVHALASELRAGRPGGVALATVAAHCPRLGTSLEAVARAATLGSDAAAELRALADVDGCARLHAVAAAWEAMSGAGARVAAVLDDLGASFEADDELAGELDALLAGPRATVTVLGLLPVAALALGSALGSHPLTMLLHTRVGAVVLAVAAALDAAGLLWMRAIAARAVAGAA